MKRFGSFSAPALCSALALASFVVACEEDGKTVPERCVELPLFDIQAAGAPTDDNASLVGNDAEKPCVTKIGHAVSSFGDSSSAGQAPSTGGSAGTGTGGSSGSGGSSGGTPSAGGSPDAGAGGA